MLRINVFQREVAEAELRPLFYKKGVIGLRNHHVRNGVIFICENLVIRGPVNWNLDYVWSRGVS